MAHLELQIGSTTLSAFHTQHDELRCTTPNDTILTFTGDAKSFFTPPILPPRSACCQLQVTSLV
eukprot:1638928-Amphidinium_carterae.2